MADAHDVHVSTECRSLHGYATSLRSTYAHKYKHQQVRAPALAYHSVLPYLCISAFSAASTGGSSELKGTFAGLLYLPRRQYLPCFQPQVKAEGSLQQQHQQPEVQTAACVDWHYLWTESQVFLLYTRRQSSWKCSCCAEAFSFWISARYTDALWAPLEACILACLDTAMPGHLLDNHNRG